jgi:hypothetical protein
MFHVIYFFGTLALLGTLLKLCLSYHTYPMRTRIFLTVVTAITFFSVSAAATYELFIA